MDSGKAEKAIEHRKNEITAYMLFEAAYVHIVQSFLPFRLIFDEYMAKLQRMSGIAFGLDSCGQCRIDSFGNRQASTDQ